MFGIFRKKIAVKLAVIIISVVTVTSIALFLYLNTITNERMYESLDNTVESASELLAKAYSGPLWNLVVDGVNDVSEGVLNMSEFVAVNVYDTEAFFSGYKKIYNNSDLNDYIKEKITTPFVIPKGDKFLNKRTVQIGSRSGNVGKVELFYTSELIQNIDRDAQINIAVCLLILAFIIILNIHILMKKFVITPITKLSDTTSKIALTKDYSLMLERGGNDEITKLYTGFNDMLQQIRKNEVEREKFFSALKKSDKNYSYMFDRLKNAVNNSDYTRVEELDSDGKELILSLNTFLETLELSDTETKRNDWFKTGQTTLSNAISGEMRLEELCQNAITHITVYLNAQVGSIYTINDKQDSLKFIAGYAYKKQKGFPDNFKIGEGLVGQVAYEKKKILFTDVSSGYVKIESSLGSSVPKNILIFPLIYEGEVKGVVEIGSVLEFTPIMVEFAELSGDIIAVAINAAVASENLNKLLRQTREQAEELKSQQEELKKANVELEEQAASLKKSEAQLQVQQEELQASNEEMEEKNELLETRKVEIEKKNLDLKKTQKEIEKKNFSLEKTKTEIEEKAKQLELATRYKSEFLANMSHELRTPLNSMLLLAKMLSDNDEDNLSEDQIDSAASIHRSGQNLLRLINDILDLSKIEARKIELSITDVNIEKFVANLDIEFRHVAKEKGVKFKTHIEEGLPQVITTDILRLEQIVRNLLSNAYKFTEEGAVSVIFARPKTDIKFDKKDLDHAKTIAISVEDTGIGIPVDKMEAIFEAFRQVDGSISRSHGGTGLGLSISRELSLLIGGELKVESTFGKGTIFTVYIPEILIAPTEDIHDTPVGDHTVVPLVEKPTIMQANDAPLADTPVKATTVPVKTTSAKAISASTKQVADIAVKTPHSDSKQDSDDVSKKRVTTEISLNKTEDAPKIIDTSNKKTILIIEDDSEFSAILAKFFQKNGYITIIASDGETGIKYAIEHKPTAVSLDIGLPGIDGWAVLNELKNNPETRHIPVHIMSAFDSTKDGLQKGAVGYLTKPVSTDDLSNALIKIEDVLTNDVKELLVVEDNEELRIAIMKLLGTKDIRTKAVGTGKEALALLRKGGFDCMILDLGLPDIPGFELLDIIENEPEIEKTPVIIYTGRELTAEEAQKLDQYSASIVMKSVDSFDRLLDETALFMHRVESDMPEAHQDMIRKIRSTESVLHGKKVLLVDDDMRNAFALNKFLKTKDMQVSIANNGQKALEALENEETPDIILMDIMMPVMDGYETMKRIRKQSKFKDLPILALTAKSMPSDREESIKSGANDYLSKPIDTAKLISMLRVWLY